MKKLKVFQIIRIDKKIDRKCFLKFLHNRKNENCSKLPAFARNLTQFFLKFLNPLFYNIVVFQITRIGEKIGWKWFLELLTPPHNGGPKQLK